MSRKQRINNFFGMDININCKNTIDNYLSLAAANVILTPSPFMLYLIPNETNIFTETTTTTNNFIESNEIH